jgi:WD40 repeat protein
MTYGQAGGEVATTDGKPVTLKEEWQISDRDTVRPGEFSISFSSTRDSDNPVSTGSTAIFNHVGDGVVVTHHQEHTLRVMDYPSLTVRESPAAHVGGCVAVALDPRGRYLASGGADSIVNIFDLNDWICARTITVCEYVCFFLEFRDCV